LSQWPYNKEMFKVKELIEPVALQALIRGVREHVIWRKLYALPDRSLSRVKQFMGNHIRVEKASLLWHRSSCFYKDNQRDWPSKWSNQGILSKHLSAIYKTCFLLRTSPIPISQITSRYIILDKNISFLNINNLFKLTFYFLQMMAEGPSTLILGMSNSPRKGYVMTWPSTDCVVSLFIILLGTYFCVLWILKIVLITSPWNVLNGMIIFLAFDYCIFIVMCMCVFICVYIHHTYVLSKWKMERI